MVVCAGRRAVCAVPLQERLAKCHGSQCGFCSPGMVMSIYTLLRNHPEPTSEQMIAALAGKYCHFLICRYVLEPLAVHMRACMNGFLFSGNLCRCTGYRPILDACKTFCKVRSTGDRSTRL